MGAYTDGNVWYPNLNCNLEIIGIGHYTILKSLCYIIQNKDDICMNDPYQRYKNIVFHYALINDCIKQILFHIYNFKTSLDSNLKLPSKKLSKDEFIEEMKKWYDEYYNRNYTGYLENGSFSIQELIKNIPNNDKVIKSFNNSGALKKYNKFSKEIIGKLRNVFIHNPSIDVVNKFCVTSKSWKFVVVRPYAIKSNRTIQNISNLEWTSLIEPKCFMVELFEEATNMLSDTWSIVFKEIEMINKHPNFHSNYRD